MAREAVRWSLQVSKETDLDLHTYLGSQGMQKGDLAKFIEDAVRRRILELTIQDIWDRNAGAAPDEVQRMVDEAVSEVRTERYAKKKADPRGCASAA